MTSRVTFGDLAAVAARHLEAPAQQVPGTGRPSRALAAAEADEYLAVLPRMLKTMVRYTADIVTASAAGQGEGPAGPWARAAAEAHRAAQYAYRLLPLEEFTGKAWPHRHLTSSPGPQRRRRRHRDDRRERPAAHPFPHHSRRRSRRPLGMGARDHLSPRAESPARRPRRMVTPRRQLRQPPDHRRISAWTRHDRAAAQAARHLPVADRPDHSRGNSSQPRAGHHRRHPAAPPHPAQHATPAQHPGPRRDVAGLQIGIAECAERLRSAAAAAVTDAAWSPAASAESFTQTARYTTLISHHCEILQQSLADRAAQLGATRLRNDLLTSATTAARARQRWLTVARAWYHIKTDATGELSPAAEEAADLAQWTGRLAYADPNWTLTSEPDGQHRPPQELAPDPGTFTRTVVAVQQATSTLTTLAAADYTQTRTAALTGRLLVPAVQAPAFARKGELYTRAPDRRASELLTAYRDAGTGSVKATTKIEAVAAEHQAQVRRRIAGRVVPAHAIALNEPDPPPGAIERTLSDLGVTDPELLNRGTTLDKAAAQLIAEAAERTAPQRWHQAVTRSGAVRNTAAITRHMMAADQSAATARLGTSMRALASNPQAQPEPLQAEP